MARHSEYSYDPEAEKRRHLSVLKLFHKLHRGYPEEDLHERAVRNYDLIADILEDPETAKAVSGTGNVPVEYVRDSAEQVISLLLENREDNPFLALGLCPSAPEEEITKRWKRLIRLYHPDRSADPRNEERAKLINYAYTRAKAPGAKLAFTEIPKKAPGNGRKTAPPPGQLRRRRNNPPHYARYAPLIFILFALSAVFITSGILMFKKMSAVKAPVKKVPPVMRSVQEPPSLPDAISGPGEIPEQLAKREKNQAEALSAQDALSLKEDLKERDSPAGVRDAPVAKARRPAPFLSPLSIKGKENEKKPEEIHPREPESPEKDQEFEARSYTGPAKPPGPYKTESDFERNNIVEEIHALVNAFLYYSQKRELEGYLSLFAKNAVENGRQVSSLVEEYRQRFGRSDEKLTIDILKIRIRDKNRAEISARYLIERSAPDDEEDPFQAGTMRWEIKKENSNFKITRYDYN
jgi:curved DNA-binding protein CbpA